MKRFFKYIPEALVVVFGLVLLRYLLIQNHPFPAPPPGAIQSNEPADTESPNRRAYFTKYTRDQIIGHYKAQLEYIPLVRLNYPPEEANRIIRDQTKSWYLEELVHPLRSSIFINGFIPQRDSDRIFIEGEQYYQKITILYVESNRGTRIFVGLVIILTMLILVRSAKLLLNGKKS
jgi:hypothetical protein